MGSWVSELILLIIPLVQSNEDSQVMDSRSHPYARTSELRAQLIVTLRGNTLFWAVHPECRDRRMVGCLLGYVRNLDVPSR